MIIQVLILVVAVSRSIAFRPCSESSGLVDAMVASSGVGRRLRTKKRPPPQPMQRALPEPLQLEQEAARTMKRKVYLTTFPHTWQSANAGLLLIAPGNLSKDS